MIELPTSLDLAVGRDGEPRAGGTDLTERRRLHLSRGTVVDLRDVPGLDAITWREGQLHVGALVTLAALADHPDVRRHYPALAHTAAFVATPQIRARATVGGNLLQHVRCWYYRRPGADCLRAGGSACHARAGDHLFHVCFDLGPCAAPHPSSLATALLAHDIRIHVLSRPGANSSASGQPAPGPGESPKAAGQPAPGAGPTTAGQPVPSPGESPKAAELVQGTEVLGEREHALVALYGDASDPSRHHRLPPGALLTGVALGPPLVDERAAYVRATSRARAEWPLVEVVARLALEGDLVRSAAITVGGVANLPLRLSRVEQLLTGKPATPESLAAAAAAATEGARPLPATGYKLDLLRGAVLDALERALSQEPAPPVSPATPPAPTTPT